MHTDVRKSPPLRSVRKSSPCIDYPEMCGSAPINYLSLQGREIIWLNMSAFQRFSRSAISAQMFKEIAVKDVI